MHFITLPVRTCEPSIYSCQVEVHVDDPGTRARRVYHMGNLLQKRGEVKEAAKMYRSAVKLDPAHKASHYNLGTLTRRVYPRSRRFRDKSV